MLLTAFQMRVCHTCQWQYDQGEQRGDGQGQTLEYPVDCHDQDGVQSPHGLVEGVIRGQGNEQQDYWGHNGQD